MRKKKRCEARRREEEMTRRGNGGEKRVARPIDRWVWQLAAAADSLTGSISLRISGCRWIRRPRGAQPF